jgi:hypothetical protein
VLYVSSRALAGEAFITPVTLDSYEIPPPNYFLKSQGNIQQTATFIGFLKNSAIMQLSNRTVLITRENIVLCCCGCNASKGQKQLSTWLQSNYCKDRGITADSVAPIIKQAIASEQ